MKKHSLYIFIFLITSCDSKINEAQISNIKSKVWIYSGGYYVGDIILIDDIDTKIKKQHIYIKHKCCGNN